MEYSNEIRPLEKKMVRSSNFELLRIIAMMAIVLSHYHFFLGEIMSEDPTSVMSIYHYTIGMGGKIGINCFMLITGYFMCVKDISMRKYLKLLSQVYFYNILIQGIFLVLGNIPLNIDSLLDIIFPFRMLHMDSFITDFFWFYLFIPFVSILIRNMTRQQHLRLITLSLVMFIGYNTLNGRHGFYVTICPVTWFAILMLVASYIRLYSPKRMELKPYIWGGVFLILVLCAIVSIIIFAYKGTYPRTLFADANSILGFSIAFSLFMMCRNLKIPYNKWINLYGGAAFGVLLIHSNCWPIRELIFKDIIDTEYYFIQGNCLIPILSCVLIYFVCGSIEILRQKTVEKPILNFLYSVLRINNQ